MKAMRSLLSLGTNIDITVQLLDYSIDEHLGNTELEQFTVLTLVAFSSTEGEQHLGERAIVREHSDIQWRQPVTVQTETPE